MKNTSNSKKKKSVKSSTSHKALPVDQLRWRCNPGSLGVRSTEEVKSQRDIIGQERAVRSLRVGLDMHHDGYNIFVTGFSGTGRTTTIKRLLREFEKREVELKDYCYVNNFKNPDMPLAITLRAGQGRVLEEQMELLVDELRKDIPALYESTRYQEERKNILQHFQDRQKVILQNFEKRVKEKGFDLVQVQVGNMMRPDVVPVADGKPTTIDQLEEMVQQKVLSETQFKTIVENQAQLEKQMAAIFRELRNIEKKAQDSLEDLEERLVMPVVDENLLPVRTMFADAKLHSYLDDVRDHVRDNLERFRKHTLPPTISEGEQQPDKDDFGEFKVNVLVDNTETDHIPIVIETNPKYKNIFGTVERELERSGVWRTDFMHIKAGSLLRANGGYLVLNALDTLIEPWAYQDLKRTLRTGKMEIHTYEPLFGVLPTAMKPEAIELDVKVIMIGSAEIYYLLYHRDEDFKKIFKIRADFDSVMPKNDTTIENYQQFVKTICDDEELRPFDAKGLAKVIEHGVRLAGRKKKLSTRFNVIADIVREANYWATKDQSRFVTDTHVDRAIEERHHRVNLVEDKIQELITDDVFMIDTQGAVVGQVNGLSVYDIGEYAFGKPSRITARTCLGRSGIINIEREAELSGPTHNKGVAILTGYLSSTFAQDKPLVMDASITFEQSYGGVDGDSASSTEIYAILSSLSGIPIRQDLAVTGSVNQKGEIQPIGGVNEKIEGFYDVCKFRGLTGTQGVLIPKQNVEDLMLREEIIGAVEKGLFHVYAVSSIEQGIEILTGMKAGKSEKNDRFPHDTIFYLANKKLEEYAQAWKKHLGGKTA